MSLNFNDEDDADEDFFGNLGNKSTKLQKLFEEDSLPETEKQQSLKYERPKATDSKQPPQNESCTLFAKVAMTFRQQEPMGNLGIALVKKTADNSLKIIIYKSKERGLAVLKIDNEMQTLFKQKGYWQFYDDISKKDWSYRFEELADDEQFKDILKQYGYTFHESVEDGNQAIDVNLGANGSNSPSRTSPGGAHVEVSKALPSLDQAEGSSKPSLIQRITKIGHPLPNIHKNSTPTTTNELSDSSDMEVIRTSDLPLSKPSIAPRNNKFLSSKTMQQATLPSSMITFNSAPIFSNMPNNLESQHLQMLLTEQRTQGSEMRMNVMKLDGKIEKILDKLQNRESGSKSNSKEQYDRDDEILELEERILLLKKENRKLKKLAEESGSGKPFKMISREIIKRCEEDLLKFNIKESDNVELVIRHCIENLEDKTETIEKQKKIVQDMEPHEVSDREQSLEEQLLEEKHKVHVLKCDIDYKIKLIKSQQMMIQELHKNLESKSKEKEKRIADSALKAIMNNLYADISSKLISSGDMEMVLSVVGTSIRQETAKVLKDQLTEKDEE